MSRLRAVWTFSTDAAPAGVALAREAGFVLAWDEANWLYLLDHNGRVQGRSLQSAPSVAACADDGSAFAVGTRARTVALLNRDLKPRWQAALPEPVMSIALGPFGFPLTAADARGRIHVFDSEGRPLHAPAEAPRPIRYLALPAAAAVLVAAADFGFVGMLDLADFRWVWRDAPVAHLGALAVNDTAELILMAAFSEGLRRYDKTGQAKSLGGSPVRIVATAFDGRRVLTVTVAGEVSVHDAAGRAVLVPTPYRPIASAVMAPLGDRGFLAVPGEGVVAVEFKGESP